MQFNTYTYAGAHIAAWLVSNPAPGAQALGAMLASYDVHHPVPGSAQARALRPWAGYLRAVFEAPDVPAKAALADELLQAADCRPRLISHGPGQPFHLHYVAEDAGLPARVKALTAAGVAHAIDDGAGHRLRVCRRAGCGIAFVDTSRNGRRHFCTVRCANQVNVASHRLRRRQPVAGDG
jgi:predicted RNA-binding Zn ribbon-like protein